MSRSQKIVEGLKNYLGFTKDYQLAEYLGYSQISLIKNGRTPIPYDKIREKIENVNPNFLFNGDLPVVLDTSEIKESEEANSPIIQWFLKDESIERPFKAKEGDTGYDIKWNGVLYNVDGTEYKAESIILAPLNRKTFGTGVSVLLPKGYGIQGRSRSGLAAKNGIQVLNSPGTIDNGYTGEIKVTLCNTSNESVTINKGDRIAQLTIEEVIVLNESVSYGEAKDFKVTERGANGFGHTGL